MINSLFFCLALIIFARLMYRIVTVKKRRLPSPEEIIKSIPRDDDNLIEYLRSLDLERQGVEGDRLFWRNVGGIEGLLRLRMKARAVADLARSSGADETEIYFFDQRCMRISICIAGSILEEIVRALFPIPHIAGKAVANNYWQMRIRIKVLFQTYQPELLESLKSAL